MHSNQSKGGRNVIGRGLQVLCLCAYFSDRLFIHGYSDNEAVSYYAAVANLDGAETGGPIIITQQETYRHVDGTVARLLNVSNPTPSWFHIDIIQTTETF